MKTTIDVPDEMLTKAKIVAATRRTTLRALVLEGLQLVTETPPENQRKQREAELRRLVEAMRAQNTEAMVPLTREELYER